MGTRSPRFFLSKMEFSRLRRSKCLYKHKSGSRKGVKFFTHGIWSMLECTQKISYFKLLYSAFYSQKFFLRDFCRLCRSKGSHKYNFLKGNSCLMGTKFATYLHPNERNNISVQCTWKM